MLAINFSLVPTAPCRTTPANPTVIVVPMTPSLVRSGSWISTRSEARNADPIGSCAVIFPSIWFSPMEAGNNSSPSSVDSLFSTNSSRRAPRCVSSRFAVSIGREVWIVISIAFRESSERPNSAFTVSLDASCKGNRAVPFSRVAIEWLAIEPGTFGGGSGSYISVRVIVKDLS